MVVNAITLESVSKVMEWTAARGIEADIVLVSVSRAKAAGRVHMMMAQNPVYVISFGGRETGGVKAAKQAVTAEKAAGSENAYPRLMLEMCIRDSGGVAGRRMGFPEGFHWERAGSG